MVGLEGPIASEVSVGFTKNPLQPTIKASSENVANAVMN
jgi:hypothetical protein